MNADKFEKYALIFLSSVFLTFLILFLTGCMDFVKDVEIAAEKILEADIESKR